MATILVAFFGSIAGLAAICTVKLGVVNVLRYVLSL
jgi:hypothetical protein